MPKFMEGQHYQVNAQTGCWDWLRSKKPGGYGLCKTPDGTSTAHREMWRAANGAIPSGLWVLHVCDNKACVNPQHLFLGTHTDNMKDMVNKGRQQKGVGHAHAKLSPEKATEIRRLYALGGITILSLAGAYDVSHATIHELLQGKTWK